MQSLHDYFERQWIQGIGEAEKLDNSLFFSSTDSFKYQLGILKYQI